MNYYWSTTGTWTSTTASSNNTSTPKKVEKTIPEVKKEIEVIEPLFFNPKDLDI
jgi:hypothetical protein